MDVNGLSPESPLSHLSLSSQSPGQGAGLVHDAAELLSSSPPLSPLLPPDKPPAAPFTAQSPRLSTSPSDGSLLLDGSLKCNLKRSLLKGPIVALHSFGSLDLVSEVGTAGLSAASNIPEEPGSGTPTPVPTEPSYAADFEPSPPTSPSPTPTSPSSPPSSSSSSTSTAKINTSPPIVKQSSEPVCFRSIDDGVFVDGWIFQATSRTVASSTGTSTGASSDSESSSSEQAPSVDPRDVAVQTEPPTPLRPELPSAGLRPLPSTVSLLSQDLASASPVSLNLVNKEGGWSRALQRRPWQSRRWGP